MSLKDKDTIITFDKASFKFNIDNNDEYSEDNSEKEYQQELEDEYNNIEYFDNTCAVIHNELIQFANQKSLTLCEYLSDDAMKQFVSDILN